jgi:hypothetical protein
MKQTYTGSCHCGDVRFEANIDLDEGSGRCNCSICRKARYWGVTVRPADFRLLSEASGLSDYQFGSGSMHHRFCRRCGVRPFCDGHIAEIGGDFIMLNLHCLDDVPEQVLAMVPVRYADGAADNWAAPPAVTAHL